MHYKRFSYKLKMLRLEKRMSQNDLADILPISRQAIGKWENGKTFPSIPSLIRLSEIFGVPLDYLLSMNADSETEKKCT